MTNDELLQTLINGVYSAGKYDCVPDDSIIAIEKQVLDKLNEADALRLRVEELEAAMDSMQHGQSL
jgi:hypothetical protein